MIHTQYAVRTLQAVAMTVGIALFLWSTGLPTFFHLVEAASITNASDTLTNSAPSGSSVHTIRFTTENGMIVGQEFVVEFPVQFDMSSLVIGDISMTVGGVATTTGAAAGVGTWGVDIGGDNSITFETPTDAPGEVASSTELVLTIGSEVGTMITNPSATTSYEIDIGKDSATTTMQDSGNVRVAIIDEVTVSASVPTTLQFEVHGMPAGSNVNGSATGTAATTTVTTLPFGELAPNVSKTLAQQLNVTTNATNGYTVTVEYTGELESSTGADINGFINGNYTQTPTGWQGPSGSISDDKTWGHWGLTSTDGTTTRSAQFGTDEWVSGSTTPIVIMGHASSSDGITDGIGSTTVGYQIQISSLQEAGDDYETTLRYIATPTF